MLSPERWRYLEVANSILLVIRHGMSVLQTDHSRAAQILPVFRLVQAEIEDIATGSTSAALPHSLPELAAQELERVQDERLKQELTLPDNNAFAALLRRCRIRNYFQLLEISALLATGGVNLPRGDERDLIAEDAVCS